MEVDCAMTPEELMDVYDAQPDSQARRTVRRAILKAMAPPESHDVTVVVRDLRAMARESRPTPIRLVSAFRKHCGWDLKILRETFDGFFRYCGDSQATAPTPVALTVKCACPMAFFESLDASGAIFEMVASQRHLKNHR